MPLGHSVFEEFLRRSKAVHLKAKRMQQTFQGTAEARVVLDNSDAALAGGMSHVVYHPLSQILGHSDIVPSGKFWNSEAERRPTTFSAHALCRRLHVGRRCGLKDLAEPLDRTPQLGCRLHSHFVHYLGAMRFDRALAGAEHVGDLLIEQAAHDKRKDLPLARRQAFVASPPLPLLPPRFTRRGAPG